MSKQEPEAFSQAGVLGVQTLDEADEGTSTGIGGKHRRSVLAPKRIFWVVLDGTSEETSVEIEYRYTPCQLTPPLQKRIYAAY